ncbi:MAG: hypothetical protein EOO60_01925 [Hymenobacter sp.]|nr:MAG: hypothetical protein EOO60_01925 [Hymenobacter sp.]
MSYLNYVTPADSPAQQFARKQELFTLLDRIGQDMEIPPGRYKEAEEKYLAVSDVLHGCPTLSQYDPQVFAQGVVSMFLTASWSFGRLRIRRATWNGLRPLRP